MRPDAPLRFPRGRFLLQSSAMRHLVFSLSLILGLSSLGCYCPVRWPRRELWASSVETRPPIQLPQIDVSTASGHAEQDGVSVLLTFIDRRRAQELFHTDLLGRGVQPLVMVLRNGSGQTYRFEKAHVDVPIIPAARAAQRSLVHPVVRVARFVKWGIWFLPGWLVESIVEPTLTLDFPGLEEAAQRPPTPDRQGVTADFLQHEMADGELGPDSVQTGMVFIRPLRMGQSISVRLINVHTQQPLVLRIPPPPLVYVERREYPHPYEKTWEAVVHTASTTKTWRIASADREQGILVVRKGVRVWRWSTLTEMTIAVERLGERTRVTLQSPLRDTTSAAYGVVSPSVGQFFSELERLLPPLRALPKKLKAQTTPSAAPTTTSQEIPATEPKVPASDAATPAATR